MNINMILNQYRFEWHHSKDIANQAKHGISFQEAALLWRDAESIEGPADVIENEIRYVRVGSAILFSGEQKVIAVVFAYRETVVRIISARSPRNYERESYEQGKE